MTSSSGNSSDADHTRRWEISFFAWMSKSQLESWLEVKQRQDSSTGLEGPCTVLFSPESLRRSSERLFRRVKQRMKRPSLSSRKRIKLEGASLCEGVDFDNTESPMKGSFTQHDKENFEEQSCGLCRLTLKSENCSGKHKHDSQNTSNEHNVSRRTISEENVLNTGNNNSGTLDAILQTNIVDDFICDEEVVNILQSGGMENEEKCSTSGTISEQKGGDYLSVMGQTTLADITVSHNKASYHPTAETVNQSKYDKAARVGNFAAGQAERSWSSVMTGAQGETAKEKQHFPDGGKRLEKMEDTNNGRGEDVAKKLCTGSSKSKPGEKDFENKFESGTSMPVATGKDLYHEVSNPPVAASFVANSQFCSDPVMSRFPEEDKLCPPGTELDSSGSVEFDIEGVCKSAPSKSSILFATDIQREKVEPGQSQQSHDSVSDQKQSRDFAIARAQSHDIVDQDLLRHRVMDQSVVTAMMQFYSEIEETDRTTESDENSLKANEENFDETKKSNASETPECANCFQPRHKTGHENKTNVESLDEPEDACARSAAEWPATCSPFDGQFLAGAADTIFSSIGSLRNLLGVSSTFDRIAEEAITSTVSSLENVLFQAKSKFNKCNQGVAAIPSPVSVSRNPPKHVNFEHNKARIESRDASTAGASGSTHLQSTHQDRRREELTHDTYNSSKG